MLYWLGYELSDIQEAKAEFLGSRVDGREAPESETLAAALGELDERSINARHYAEAAAFYRDYDAALGRIATLVTDVIVVVVGNARSRVVLDRPVSGTRLDHNVRRDLVLHSAGIKEVHPQRPGPGRRWLVRRGEDDARQQSCERLR